MNIIDRFSTHLRDVLARSIKIATELKTKSVEPIHLLFALSLQKGSLASEILQRYNMDGKKLEKEIIEDPTPEKIGEFGLSAFSEESKELLEKAMNVAQKNGHNYLGTEHLLAAFISIDNKWINRFFPKKELRLPELENQIKIMLANSSQFPQISEASETFDKIQESLGEELTPYATTLEEDRKTKKKDSALDFFATNLTEKQIQSGIDPVIGREYEIERMMQILCRRTKNNPVLLGDPGVGKTAIVEGLAKKIVSGEVPEILLNKKIYSLDLGMLIAGTTFRGEFEARLRQVIDNITKDPNIILFIDELHNIVGAGSNQGTLDAANMLKPALARGQIRCIGATTTAEFKKYIENDAALERRFQPIYVKESSVEDTVKILFGIRKNYELFHNLKITDSAIRASAQLAHKYMTNQFLPDKAIDLLDETAAAKKLKIKPSLAQVKYNSLQRELDAIVATKEEAAGKDDFAEAMRLKEKEKKLIQEINKLKATVSGKIPAIAGIVNEKDVINQVAKIVEIPASQLLLKEKNFIANLEIALKKQIIGQDNTIKDVCALIRQAKLQLSNPNRPLASFVFAGESGVGKTELAKTLANELYPGQNALVQLNMGEFTEGFSVSKILGSPAGYVGYREKNQFTDKLKMNPYAVILFDEADKAHKDVLKLLLQMLENGEVTDSVGKKISLKHAIIILTTSAGVEETKKAKIGFENSASNSEDTEKKLTEKLKELFGAELINRLDKICLFNQLSKQELEKIAALEIDDLNSRLQPYKTIVKANDDIFPWILSKSGKNISARELRRKLRGEIENIIAEIIMSGKIKSSHKIFIEKDKLQIK
ncbi:MAG: ATP-dependent Clp protease ATP-binding subunit [Patescibacteria group bacterium]